MNRLLIRVIDMRHLILICLLAISLPSINANAHGGGWDKQGGHNKAGIYHCHREPCISTHKKSNEAFKEAVDKNRRFSLIYKRSDWPHWSDLDHDCQDSRVETLIKFSSAKVSFQGGDKCEEVETGKWYDPYTNQIFTEAGKLDVDHRIALGEAHRYGGANWTRTQKQSFANDPINLIPVYLGANRSKSDKPAHKWMPKNKGYWCEYIKTREAVSFKYDLNFPAKEKLHNKNIVKQYCT